MVMEEVEDRECMEDSIMKLYYLTACKKCLKDGFSPCNVGASLAQHCVKTVFQAFLHYGSACVIDI